MNLISLVFNMIWIMEILKIQREEQLLIKYDNIAKNPKYEGYQRGLASVVYKFFDKKYASLTDKSVSGSDVNIEVKHDEQLAEELHKRIIRNFKKRTVYS